MSFLSRQKIIVSLFFNLTIVLHGFFSSLTQYFSIEIVYIIPITRKSVFRSSSNDVGQPVLMFIMIRAITSR